MMNLIQPEIDGGLPHPAQGIEWVRSAKRRTTAILGLVSLAVLTMHARLGTYSRFMGDDYCSAAEGRKFGILRAAWYWYLNWNGRYSANILDAFFGKLGPGFTPAVTALVLFAWLAVLATAIFLVTSHLDRRAGPLLAASVAAAVLFLTLALAPNVAQALYWGQGMRSLVPPLIAMALYVGLFAWFRRGASSARSSLVAYGLSFLLTYGAGGFSETYTAFQVAALVLTLGTWLVVRRSTITKRDVLFLSAGLFGAILSLVTVIVSPGNSARAAFYPPPPSFPALLEIALSSYGRFLGQVAGSGTGLLFLSAAMALGLWIGAYFDFRSPDWRVALLILLLGMSLIFSCFPPAAYGESAPPPDRTLLIPTFLLVTSVVSLGLAIGGWLSARRNILELVSTFAIILIVASAAISVFRLSALEPEYAAYANAWERFHTQLAGYRADGISSAQIATEDLNANNWVGLDVLGDNPKFWLNKCVSDYYGVHIISTTP